MTRYLFSFCNRIRSVLQSPPRRYLAFALGTAAAVSLCAMSAPATAYGVNNYSTAAAVAAASEPAVEPAKSAAVASEAAATVTLSTTSAGCGKKATQTGSFNMQTTDGANRTRTFLVQIPAQYNPSQGYSLNFVFHGAGGNSSQSYSWGLQNVSGASEAGIFVFPDGIAYQNYGIGWDDSKNGYDLPFFDNMLKVLEADFCVNEKRVFVAGFSWGGDFVTALVCNRGDSIRAAATNSTTDEYGDVTKYTTYSAMPCSTTVHPTLRYEHAIGGDSQYPAPRFATTAQLYNYLNSCGGRGVSYPSTTTSMTCISYVGCANGHGVIECSFNPSIGHAFPPNWASDTWAFFQGFK